MPAFASLLIVLSLLVAAPATAYFYDSDGDGLPDFYEAKHGMHGDGFRHGGFQLDYTYTDHDALSDTHRFSFTMAFGDPA